MLHALLSPLLPCVHDHFGVAAGAESVAQCLQFGAQLAVIVDLAVVANQHAAILIAHRLLAAGQIDHRQAPVAEAHARFHIDVTLVRTAVMLGLVHALEQRRIDAARAPRIKHSDYSTHDL